MTTLRAVCSRVRGTSGAPIASTSALAQVRIGLALEAAGPEAMSTALAMSS
ncbi:hypothetical protein AB0H00_04135 [Nocardia sp. NPDC023852]|uniref:hypothetical protein n=1 Tax=Nocardia sp. NPDC023852 TaxID=3154697 RepID=UPI0033F0CD27